jgi:hypothetical protein
MRYILELGHDDYLVHDDDIEKLVKIMSRLISVKPNYDSGEMNYLVQGEVKFSIKCISDNELREG